MLIYCWAGDFQGLKVSQGKIRSINRWGGILNHLPMAYLLSNTCTKNYWNQTTIVEIFVGGWVVFFFETQCLYWSNREGQAQCKEVQWFNSVCNFADRRLRFGKGRYLAGGESIAWHRQAPGQIAMSGSKRRRDQTHVYTEKPTKNKWRVSSGLGNPAITRARALRAAPRHLLAVTSFR